MHCTPKDHSRYIPLQHAQHAPSLCGDYGYVNLSMCLLNYNVERSFCFTITLQPPEIRQASESVVLQADRGLLTLLWLSLTDQPL